MKLPLAALLGVLLLSLLASSQTGPAGPPPSSTRVPQAVRDPKAVALVRLALLRNGALAQARRDTVASGTIHTFRDDQTQSLLIKTSGTDYLRNEVGSGFVFSRAGEHGLLRYGGKNHSMPAQSIAYKRAEHLPSLLLISEIESPQLQCQMIGAENVNGVAASHIRLSVVPSDGSDPHIEDLLSETHVWIDATGLIVRARVFLFSPDAIENRSPVDLYYSDYRQIEGFLVPFHIIRDIEGQKDSEMIFDSIDLNTKLSPIDFQ